MTMSNIKVHNFSAGPGVLPQKVLEKVQSELLDFNGTNCSLMELSHRSKDFENVIHDAEKDLRELLNIPQNYKVLFMQGGATAQFSAVIYNLIGSLKNPVDYIVTGAWSEKAAVEAKRLGAPVRMVLNTKKTNHDGQISSEELSNLKFADDAAFVYYCSNETIHGVEFSQDPPPFLFDKVPSHVPIVCDMSSNILTKPIQVEKYGVIFAGAQKNIGPSGVTIVIIKEDLIHPDRICKENVPPLMLDYKTFADSGSLYNTPPTFPIYVCGLVLKWIKEEYGNLETMSKLATDKSKLIYETIQQSNGFYHCPVHPPYRSKINIPFRIMKNTDKDTPDIDLEAEFLKQAEKIGLSQLKGHRSVGGIRASLYNALTLKSVQALTGFMTRFASSCT